MVLSEHPLAGLRARRELKGISASTLAHEIGVEPQTYYRAERGDRRIYLDRALGLARALGCTVEQLSQEPTIDEKIAALHAQEAKRLADSQPLDASNAEARGYTPIYAENGHDIVGWQEPPKAKPVGASPAPASAREVVSTPSVPQTAPQPPTAALEGTNAGIDEYGNHYVDEDDD